MSEAPLESALAAIRKGADGYGFSLSAFEAAALLAELERLRAQVRSSIPDTLAAKAIEELCERPTREQALRAMLCWAHDRHDTIIHTEREECLDAAMREGEA